MASPHPILQAFIPLVRGLALALGPDYEIVLHDVATPEHSILAMENAHITGRSDEAPLRDYALYLLQTADRREENFVSNYLTRSSEGKRIRSNTIYIRDPSKKIIGFLCINYDMTKAEILQSMVDHLVTIGDTTSYSEFERDGESGEVNSRSEEILERNLRMIRKYVGKPLHLSKKQEKLQAIRHLEEEGFFLLKGAVEAFAQETGNSVFTIYRYLREIREEEK
ncbi:MAG TPA: helix-turn-helix transcriptional regulator [Synergistaceae bacterium]|nr:helix-turn-helix transcriptional regulator [Synergistaceae bacterium]HPJ25048.1 helix-turn-helix transcriptional regulator [Synergistaceae bacterium]